MDKLIELLQQKIALINELADKRIAKLQAKIDALTGGGTEPTEPVYEWRLTHRKFVYDGNNVVAVFDVESETDETTGETTTSDVLSQTMLWGEDLSGSLDGAGGVGGLLAFTLHSVDGEGNPVEKACLSVYDGNGNVMAYVDGETGEEKVEFEYSPFGKLKVDTDSEGLFVFRFSTKMYDGETGKVHYRYRDYDPELGRWLSRDPIEEKNGELNLYDFAQNDAVTYFDAFGLWKKVDGNHTWCADAGDNLKDLAKKSIYGGNKENWACIWPAGDFEEPGYNQGKVKPGHLYDASNLAVPSPDANEKHLVFSLVTDVDVHGFVNKYDAIETTPSSMAAAIAYASGRGDSPISRLTWLAHGGYYNQLKENGRVIFYSGSLNRYDVKPSLELAKQGIGPKRCWFTRDAKVRLYGCVSHKAAKNFANNALRDGATAYGTNYPIYILDDGRISLDLIKKKYQEKYDKGISIWESFNGGL